MIIRDDKNLFYMEKEDRLSVEKQKGPTNDGIIPSYQVLNIQQIHPVITNEKQILKKKKMKKLKKNSKVRSESKIIYDRSNKSM